MIMMMLLMNSHLLVHLREQVLLVLKLPQHSLKIMIISIGFRTQLRCTMMHCFAKKLKDTSQKGLGRMRKVI